MQHYGVSQKKYITFSMYYTGTKKVNVEKQIAFKIGKSNLNQMYYLFDLDDYKPRYSNLNPK